MGNEAVTAIRVTRVIHADPELVFDAWTEPDQLRQWSSPEGAIVTHVRVDLSIGGRYRIQIRGAETTHTATGVYREIERPKRLVYTWDWEEPEHAMGETLVTVEFRNQGQATEVVLTHDLFPSSEARQSHYDGWTSCLDRLGRVLDASPS